MLGLVARIVSMFLTLVTRARDRSRLKSRGLCPGPSDSPRRSNSEAAVGLPLTMASGLSTYVSEICLSTRAEALWESAPRDLHHELK